MRRFPNFLICGLFAAVVALAAAPASAERPVRVADDHLTKDQAEVSDALSLDWSILKVRILKEDRYVEGRYTSRKRLFLSCVRLTSCTARACGWLMRSADTASIECVMGLASRSAVPVAFLVSTVRHNAIFPEAGKTRAVSSPT